MITRCRVYFVWCGSDGFRDDVIEMSWLMICKGSMLDVTTAGAGMEYNTVSGCCSLP